MIIFHGFKTAIFNPLIEPYLSLGLDFCYLDDTNSNAGFILFSYPNISLQKDFDFIEYAFNNNTNYVILDFLEDFKIDNNIFGYIINSIIVYYTSDYNGVNYILVNSGEIFDQNYMDPNDSLIKVVLEEGYSFGLLNINFHYYVKIAPSDNISEINEHCDEINDIYGDRNYSNSYDNEQKNSIFNDYNIYTNESLKTICNDTNCILCLEIDINYCIVCKGKYTFIFGDEYKFGKKKICSEVQNDINSTEDFSHNIIISYDIKTDNLTNSENINKDELTYNEESSNNINRVELSNENNLISDYKSSILSDKISYEYNNDELSENKKNSNINLFEDSTNINKDVISNKNEQSIISDKNENIILSDYHSTIDTNIIYTEKLSYIANISSNNLLITDISTNNNGAFIEELMNDNFKDMNLSNEQIKKLYESIKKDIIEKYNGENTIINTGNVKIQISSIDIQKYSEELSNIDLGECGEILKKKYCKKENDSLIMMKFDFKPENQTSTYVQYEIYEPFSKIFIDLEECSNNKISIDVPIELDPELEGLYQRLMKSGYNIFHSNDTFYNDVCATYTTQNGTDMLLYDRRMNIFQSTVNISLCQDGCDFQSYNANTKKAKCECLIQTNKIINTDISELKFDRNEMIDQFYETLDNSNFRVLICYNLVFNLKIFKKNFGCIFMSILLFLFEILIIIYIIIGSKKINEFIQIILKNKYCNNNNSIYSANNIIAEFELINCYSNINNKDNETKIKKIIKRPKENNQVIIQKKSQKSFIFPKTLNLERIRNTEKKTTIDMKIKMKGAPPKKRFKKNEELNLNSQLDNLFPKTYKKKSNNNANSHDNIEYLDNSKSVLENKEKMEKFKEKDLDIYNKFNDNKKSISRRRKGTTIITSKNNNIIISQQKEKDLNSDKKKHKKEGLHKKEKQKENFNNLNIEEINNLEYEEAIEMDKRTYLQYYFSLLKKKHLFLFTFFPTNDYL